ncbi:N-acetylmuramic acid 6-phosphate etherase [Fusibacter sp. 3D3]|uniref:N-acetylmuramic acid 6-phosphate etherase n=1 Tax=Fusibacter sp. 3D3 TaxID=1048380 RepID=UPI000857BED6|nr:N-acetylmuramic acid 6-phosphate etherase [Fusibacter sp. 3D3]GAU75949.1 N-acetylmuramic acid 6-phosphate etherase [Fusibacter sp. 3D3]
MFKELETLTTEKVNDKSNRLDRMSTHEFVKLMNEEDKKVAFAVEAELEQISKMIEIVTLQMKKGGRLIYIGAGTSGRLGILDAVECPPTFGTDSSLVVGIIAGGEKAFKIAVEGAEDDETLAIEDLEAIGLNAEDVVIGLAASGRTPYVINGIKFASRIGCKTGAVSCNKNSEIGKHALIPIEVVVGPEVLTGSTRLKAGSAQKMVLNMISTGVMVGMGKMYKNLMVDLQMTNLKLVERGKGIIMKATGVDYNMATEYLEKSGKHVKTAIVMIESQCSYEEAIVKLKGTEGILYKAIEESIKI